MLSAVPSLTPLLAPFAFAFGRAARSNALIDWSARLDPLFARAHLHRMGRQGLSLYEAYRFARMSQLMAAVNFNCENLVRDCFSCSRSQLLQDIFVVLATRAKRGGYFVEVGVGNDDKLSNTYLLEKQYGWTGLLAEPNPEFHQSIVEKRGAVLDPRAVFNKSGETLDLLMNTKDGEFSTLVGFEGRDSNLRSGALAPVKTVTLDDLLAEHNAPTLIDYISIDTEGSEYEVLQGLDLTKRKVKVFTIGSNYDKDKMKKIDNIMLDMGYRIALPTASYYDSWYLHPDVENIFI